MEYKLSTHLVTFAKEERHLNKSMFSIVGSHNLNHAKPHILDYKSKRDEHRHIRKVFVSLIKLRYIATNQ